MKKERLDKVLTDLGYFDTKSKAAAAILAGNVMIGTEVITKSGFQIDPQKEYDFKVKSMPFVSRGGFKLKKALESFPIEVKDRICLDAGASTGGFTDCLLQNGAKFVYAADVGYGQLAWKLRTDERVVNLERTNFRYLTKEIVNDKIDFASIDVSFISLKKILPVLFDFLKDSGKTVALIKPQFEAGKDKVGKKGVVRDINTHKEVISGIVDFAFETGFSVLGLDFSPIRGPEGNIEYLIFLSKDNEKQLLIDNVIIDGIAEKSHTELSGE